ncbi:MAG: thiol:disulfide oxidoreductase [Caulobacter sp.]|nr:thiol:disulfide oxidoreductase [Caulobacter sp.]
MIDLHFVSTPNGHKVSIMLAETGLEHRVIPYNLLRGEHLGDALAAINPNRRLPAIVDHDPIGGGAPLALFESGAILLYLAEDYSIADMACWPWIRAARAIDIDIARWPAIKAWYGRIAQRPAVLAGAAVPENDPAAGRVMTLNPDQWSALFGERMLNAVRS